MALCISEDQIPQRGDIVQDVERFGAGGDDAVWITLAGPDGKEKRALCHAKKD